LAHARWAVVVGVVGVASAGCGSRLAANASGRDAAPAKSDVGIAHGGEAPDAAPAPGVDAGAGSVPGSSSSADGGGGWADASAGAGSGRAGAAGGAGGGRADASADAGGIALPPLPPLACATTAASPVGSTAVHACGGQLALSSTVTLGTSPVDHFYRCGAMGPEIATDVRLSPDGSRLAALTGAATVRLFATDDWHEVAQLATAIGRIDAFAFSPDGRSLATLSMEAGQIVLWDAATGHPTRTVSGKGTGGGIASLKVALAFSRDGSKLVSSLGGVVDLRTGAVVSLPIGNWWVEELAFTACDSKVYARYAYQIGDSNDTLVIALFDATTGQGQGLYGAWDSYSGGSALSQDGRLVAVSSAYHPTGSYGFDLAIYRADTGEQLAYLPVWTAGHIEAFTPDGSALLVSTAKGTLDEWRLADGKVVTSLYVPTGSRILGFPRPDAVMVGGSASSAVVYSLQAKFAASYFSWPASHASFSADGSVGAAVAPDGSLFHVWRSSDQTPLCEPTAPTATAAVTSFALSGDGSVVGAGKADGTVELFDSHTGKRRATIETIQGPVRQLVLSGDGQRVATQIASESPILVWSTDGTLVGSVAQPAATLAAVGSRSFALSPDGRTVGILAPDGGSILADNRSATLVDVASGASQTIDPMGFWATGAPFSPDSGHLAGRANGSVATWPVGGGLRDDILVAPSQAAPGNDLTLASDWSLAAAGYDAGVVVWNPLDGNISLDLSLPGTFGAATVSLGSATLAVSQYLEHEHASDYQITHLYDIPTGTELRRFDSSTSTVLLSPDGQRAYTLDGPDVIAWCR
jgi:WD40 repeat protein